MLIAMSLVWPLAVLVYLVAQAISDVKTKEVYTFPSLIFAIFGGVLLVIFDLAPLFEILAVLLLLFLLSWEKLPRKLRTFAWGDAKGLFITYTSLAFWSSPRYPTPVLFGIEVLIAMASFLAVSLCKKRPKGTSWPFFNHILLAYTTTTALAIIVR